MLYPALPQFGRVTLDVINGMSVRGLNWVGYIDRLTLVILGRGGKGYSLGWAYSYSTHAPPTITARMCVACAPFSKKKLLN